MLTLPSALPLPPETPPAQDAVFLQPASLENWLNTHIDDGDKSADRLLDLLKEINRARLDISLLQQITPLLLQPVQRCSKRFERRFAEAPFPLPAGEYSRSATARELLLEFALIQKRIATKAVASHPVDDATLEPAIRAMITALRRALFQASLLYLPPPVDFWREMHGLYRLAEARPPSGVARDDITLEYVHALTFAAAAPHRLQPDEMTSLASLLPDWCHHVHLLPMGNGTAGSQSLIVDLESDASALPATTHEHRDDPDRHRLLDLTALQTRLRNMAEQDSHAMPVSFAFSKKLIQAFGAAPARSFFRVKGSLVLEAHRGVEAIHCRLSSTTSSKAMPLRVVNESATGYCVTWDDSLPFSIQIGEITGIRQQASMDRLALGVIRWMRNSIVNGPRVGIEIISNQVKAIEINHPDGTQTKALLLPAVRATGRPETLILPLQRERSGDVLQVVDQRGDKSIRLTRLLESTPAFTHYQFDTYQDS